MGVRRKKSAGSPVGGPRERCGNRADHVPDDMVGPAMGGHRCGVHNVTGDMVVAATAFTMSSGAR